MTPMQRGNLLLWQPTRLWMVILGVIAMGGCAAQTPSQPSPAASTAEQTPAAASDGPVAISDLAHAVVQIQALQRDGGELSPAWSGSGTVISPEGTILTNAHVVDDRTGEYDVLGVAITDESDEPPELTYLAEIAAVDYALDLAVVEIVSDEDGQEVELDLPSVVLGDSEDVEIGDEIRILGYPGIGGETITLTDGVVSGFTVERDIEGRAWIKTDATIAGGNSGGLAVDADGRLIGVPTIVSSGSDADAVDCRYVQDTNRDGLIDETDSCVPVGGFINGLRPVNLALPLIDAVRRGERYVPEIEPEPEPGEGFQTDDVSVSNLVFAPGVTADDEPTELVDVLPADATQVCAFWDYQGMADGMTWEALWFVDGEVDEEGSIIGDTWVGGESGNWWVCKIDELSGLDEGLYEVVISVESEGKGSNAIFVGGDHPPVRFVIANESPTEVCYAQLSPTGAQNWGFDDLGADVTVPGGESHELDIPAGTYDLRLSDCDGETLVEEYEIDVSEETIYTVNDT